MANEKETTEAQEILWAGIGVACFCMIVGLLAGAVTVAIKFGASWDGMQIMVYAVTAAGMIGFLGTVVVSVMAILSDSGRF
jgi:cation transporter-like permease